MQVSVRIIQERCHKEIGNTPLHKIGGNPTIQSTRLHGDRQIDSSIQTKKTHTHISCVPYR